MLSDDYLENWFYNNRNDKIVDDEENIDQNLLVDEDLLGINIKDIIDSILYKIKSRANVPNDFFQPYDSSLEDSEIILSKGFYF